MCLAATYNIKHLDLDGELNLALGHWVQVYFLFFNTIRAQELFFSAHSSYLSIKCVKSLSAVFNA